ncbi:hypothetical protein [Acidisarcina polymorpha]|uniref:hypothetical protein n=1 Tax=Acidisarcina polymorpha TaxID=2211140 RepID=UPI000DEEC1E5|nr:hypothetical protein [Acidisarcina polymorpha]
MHEFISNWSVTLYAWARAAVGIVLWFWVISGAVFCLRFLAFVLLDRNSRSSKFAAASNLVSFPMDQFDDKSRQSPVSGE